MPDQSARPMFDFYTHFYQAMATSAANARYCTLVYGRKQFEAEGNQCLFDSHLGEANGVERAHANGAGGRYLYLAPRS